MNNNIFKAFGDFFSKEVLIVSAVSFFVSLVAFAVFVFLALKLLAYGFSEFIVYVESEGGEIALFESVKNYLLSFAILKYLLAIDFFSMLVNIVIALNIFVLLYFSFLFIYSIVIAFFAPKFVKSVQKKHYQNVNLASIHPLYVVWIYVKTTLITVLGIVLFLPLFFIPALNFLLFVPLYYFFHKSLILDVSSAINTKAEYLKIKKANWFEFKFQTLILFLMSIVPILGILFIPFYFIYIAHVVFEQTQSLRSVS
jgi:hypothetical protein